MSQKENHKSNFWNSYQALAILVFFAIAFRYVVASPYKIPTGSMIPTLKIGDFLFVSKMSYSLKVPFTNRNLWTHSTPKAGDVIVFQFPKNMDLDYIKRVVATEGDLVEMVDHELHVNGVQVSREPVLGKGVLFDHNVFEKEYLDIFKEDLNGTQHLMMRYKRPRQTEYDYLPFKVPAGYVFAMGDNRDNSEDSRFWGPLAIKNIRGQAKFIWLSLDSHNPMLSLGRIEIPSIRWNRLGMEIR